MGKMKGDIYKYYMLKYDANDPANSNPRLPKWACRFCNKHYVQNATKMRHHVLNMCEEIPAPLKLALLDIPNLNVHDDSNDETKLFLSSLGMTQSSAESMTITVSSPATSSSATVSSSPVSSSKLSPLSKKNNSKSPPKKRRTLSLTPPASSHSSSSHSSHQQHPIKFSNLGTNLNLIASANNTLTALSSINTDQESLWVILARALYSSGTSLSIVENPYWLEVFERISPGLNLPSTQLLAKDLLDKEVLKIQSEVEKQVADAKYVSLQCEAWMNWRGESMITFVVTTPTPFSYKTFPTGGTHHSDTIIADCTSSTIRDIEALTSLNSVGVNPSHNFSKVLSVVTTTKPYMKSAWTKIHAMYPDLITFGCIVEGLELFLESILAQPQIAEILTIIRCVVTKIRRSPTVNSKYDQIQSQLSPAGKVSKLRLPRNPSRTKSSYLSFLLSLHSLLHSQTTLKWLAEDEESLEIIGEELSSFTSDEFWLKIQILCKILFPPIKWLNLMRDSKPEISSVPKAFVEIQEAVEESLGGESIWHKVVHPAVLESLDRRKQDCLHSVHLAAHLLDPREQGSCLDQDQVVQATEFIDNISETYDLDSSAVIAELSQYRMRTDFYSKPFLWKVTKKVQGSIWWTTMAPKTHLAQLAAAILNISPCTFSMDSVITEASLSSETLRKRTAAASSTSTSTTTTARECKLVYVAHNLRINCRGSLDADVRRAPRVIEYAEGTPGPGGSGNDDRNVSSNSNFNNSNSNGTLPLDWSSLDAISNDVLSDSDSDCDEDFDVDDDPIIITELESQPPEQERHHPENSGGGEPLKESSSFTDIKIVSGAMMDTESVRDPTNPTEHDHSFYQSS